MSSLCVSYGGVQGEWRHIGYSRVGEKEVTPLDLDTHTNTETITGLNVSYYSDVGWVKGLELTTSHGRTWTHGSWGGSRTVSYRGGGRLVYIEGIHQTDGNGKSVSFHWA